MNNIQDRIIAAGVIISTLVLGFVLLSAIGEYHVEGNLRDLTIDFDRIDNMKPNVTQIKLAGLPIGLVTEVRMLTPEERRDLHKAALARSPAATNAALPAVRITGQVDQNVFISADTTVSIRQAGMMSEHYIELTPGPPDSKPLPDGTRLAGTSGKGLNDLMDPAATLLANLRDATAHVKTITAGLTDKVPSTITKLNEVLSDAKALTGELSTEESRAKLRDTLSNAKSLTDNLKVSTENLKVATTHAKLATATLAQRPWRLVFGGKPNDLPDEERIISSNKPVPVKPVEGGR